MPEDIAEKLTWQRNGNTLIVSNPTAYYMNFSTIKMGNTSVKNATWVSPKSSASFTIPAGASGDVVWTLITDYGSVGKEHRARL